MQQSPHIPAFITRLDASKDLSSSPARSKTTTRHAIAAMAALTLTFSSMLTQPIEARTAPPQRVVVKIENLAPQQGTSQTPFWVGFHEGDFDTYDGATPASNDPRPGSVAMERICEDGNTGPISQDFADLSFGVDATIAGVAGPIAPGETVSKTFLLDALNPDTRYFSYASMILPSNDFCISNGNPLAHPIFDDAGNFIAQNFFVTGDETLDAGTEVNDEIPANTAFFGQQTPNTGVDEGGLIGDIGDLPDFLGFLSPDARQTPPTILGTPQFSMADFTVRGYPFVKISFTIATAIVDNQAFESDLSGDNEVPPVETPAYGQGIYKLVDGGTRLTFSHLFANLNNVVMAHLHLAPEGQNGPVVASLMPPAAPGGGAIDQLSGELTTQDLVGPLHGLPLDALIAAIQAGTIYVNIHTNDGVAPPNSGPGDFPAGELRGQLSLDNDA